MSIVKLIELSKSYKDVDGDNLVLDKLSLEVNAGEFVAVVGPSGSGKSTLLSIAGVLLKQDQGSVTIDGEIIDSKKLTKGNTIRKEKIGFIFQSHHLLPYLKGFDQVDMVINDGVYTSKTQRKEAVIALFKHLGIEDCLNKYPSKMSGGQRQRVAIARAFINKPSLILADEPTASLDGQRGLQVVSMIAQEVRRQGAAAIMVTHDERVLSLVDKVYRIDNGKLKVE